MITVKKFDALTKKYIIAGHVERLPAGEKQLKSYISELFGFGAFRIWDTNQGNKPKHTALVIDKPAGRDTTAQGSGMTAAELEAIKSIIESKLDLLILRQESFENKIRFQFEKILSILEGFEVETETPPAGENPDGIDLKSILAGLSSNPEAGNKLQELLKLVNKS